jgi:hypothetical protein
MAVPGTSRQPSEPALARAVGAALDRRGRAGGPSVRTSLAMPGAKASAGAMARKARAVGRRRGHRGRWSRPGRWGRRQVVGQARHTGTRGRTRAAPGSSGTRAGTPEPLAGPPSSRRRPQSPGPLACPLRLLRRPVRLRRPLRPPAGQALVTRPAVRPPARPVKAPRRLVRLVNPLRRAVRLPARPVRAARLPVRSPCRTFRTPCLVPAIFPGPARGPSPRQGSRLAHRR